MGFNKKELPMEKFFREHLENNGRIYDKNNHPMNKINQVKVDAFPNLDLSGEEKIELYDRYNEEMKDFAKHLVISSVNALKSLRENYQYEQATNETHRALNENGCGDGVADIHRKLIEKKAEAEELNEEANIIIIDSAMAEINRLHDCNTDLRIKLSTIMSLTSTETLEIKSSKLYRKQRKKIKKYKKRVRELTIEVFDLRHMGDLKHIEDKAVQS